MNLLNSVTRWFGNTFDSSLNTIVNNFNKNWRSGKKLKSEPTKSNLLTTLAPFEEYFSSLQSILIWENPFVSATSLIALNCIYWYVYLTIIDCYFVF